LLRAFDQVFPLYGNGQTDGNCHEICIALTAGLTAGKCAHGWAWVTGQVHFGEPSTPAVEHSWMEYDGWALDASNGKILIVDAQLYVRLHHGTITTRRGAAALHAFVDEHLHGLKARHARNTEERNAAKRARRARRAQRRARR